MTELGQGGDKDNAAAVQHYRFAAEKPLVAAQSRLGLLLHRTGKAEEAVKWLTLAAEAGDRVAQNNLGALYRDGRGVEKNLEAAQHWFRKSAEAGYPKAQLNLGLLLDSLAKTGKATGK